MWPCSAWVTSGVTVFFLVAPGCSRRAVWHQGACHHLCIRWDRCQGVEHRTGEVWGEHLGAPWWNRLSQLQWVTFACLVYLCTACYESSTSQWIYPLSLLVSSSAVEQMWASPTCQEHQLLSLLMLVTLWFYGIGLRMMLCAVVYSEMQHDRCIYESGWWSGITISRVVHFLHVIPSMWRRADESAHHSRKRSVRDEDAQ